MPEPPACELSALFNQNTERPYREINALAIVYLLLLLYYGIIYHYLN